MTQVSEIYVDVDGVLADFVGAACTLIGLGREEADCWEFYQKVQISKGVAEFNPANRGSRNLSLHGFWEIIQDKGGPRFWTDLNVLPGAHKIVDQCDRLVGRSNVRFLTSPSKDYQCYASKAMWLVENKFLDKSELAQRYIPFGQKHLLAQEHRLLIDDREKNVEEWVEAGGHAILHPADWNPQRIFEWDWTLDRLQDLEGNQS